MSLNQVSAGDKKLDFIHSWFNNVLCSVATAKLFELNEQDLLSLFLEAVPYPSLEAALLLHFR